MSRVELLLWLRVRQVPTVVGVLVGLGLIGWLWGAQIVPLPRISGLGGAVTVLWFYPVLAACAIALTMTSAFPDRERLDSIGLDLRNRLALSALVALASLMLSGLAAVEAGPHSASQLVGGLLYWTALAVLSAKLLGPNLAWVLPLVVHLPVTWWGFGDSGEPGRWWAVPAQEGGAATLLSGLACFSAAMLLSLLNRHRLRRLGWRW